MVAFRGGPASVPRARSTARSVLSETVFASQEPKAAQAAEVVASLLDLSSTPRPDLHENDRSGLPVLSVAERVPCTPERLLPPLRQPSHGPREREPSTHAFRCRGTAAPARRRESTDGDRYPWNCCYLVGCASERAEPVSFLARPSFRIFHRALHTWLHHEGGCPPRLMNARSSASTERARSAFCEGRGLTGNCCCAGHLQYRSPTR